MATTFRSKKNYPLGVGTLNTAIDDNDLTVVLDAGQGASFPSSNFTISIDEEIILIDSRSTDTLTVNASGRGYDSSTASAHAAGVAIDNYQIVKDFTDLETAVNGIENGTTTLAKVVVDGSSASSMKLSDSGTNTVVSALELYHMTSGTPASGLGAKLLLGAEDSAGNAEAAIEIHGYLTTVTNTSEQGAFLLRVKNAGSFMDALAITVASNTATVGSNQTTVNLWNATATTVNAFSAATTIAVGAANSQGQFGAASGSNTPKWSVGLGNMRQSSSTQYYFDGGTTTFVALLNSCNTATTATVQLDFASSTPTSQLIQCFRFTSASAGACSFAVYSPGTGTQNFLINAKTGDTTMAGALTVNGSGSVFGDASTDTFTFTGRMIVRAVTDAGPMTATGGSTGEIVRNTSDNKFYGCTVGHASAATWVAFN